MTRMTNPTRRTACSLLVAIITPFVGSQTANADAFPQLAQIKNVYSHRCLEVYNGSTGRGTRDLMDGATVDQWTCLPGHTNQDWSLRFVAPASYRAAGYASVQFVNGNLGLHQEQMCLDDTGNGLGNGSPMQQWRCLYTNGRPDANQVWIVVPTAWRGRTYYRFINQLSHRALEINGNESTPPDPSNLGAGIIADQWWPVALNPTRR
jgi:hypothetical protein